MDKVIKDFSILSAHPEMVYLDSAATSLKPRSVVESVSEYLTQYSSNIHRGLYPIAVEASARYEDVRERVRRLINAGRREEIIFTKGATESLNLIASCLAGRYLQSGSEVLTTIVEHHANFIPWQQLASENRAQFKVAIFDPLSADTRDILEVFQSSLTAKTSILALTHVSNALGMILPVHEIIETARQINPKIIVVLDACQSVQHIPIDVSRLGVDFLVFSGHKCFGPTGSGVVYGRYDLLVDLPPYQWGGDMIDEVSIDQTTFAKPPARFEAGTPPIGEVIGLGSAIDYIQDIGLDHIQDHVDQIRSYILGRMGETFGDRVSIYDNPHLPNAGIITFNIRGVHAHDTAQILAEHEVCIRAGHHCAQPLHTHLGVPATCRASLSVYNTMRDADRLIEVLGYTCSTFGV